MRKIYVLDDNGVLQEIDAGVTEYAELTDAPILTTLNGVQLVGSTVSLVDGELTLAAAPGHAWTDEDTEENKSELTIFCENAPTGRYDIFTARFGTEILMIDKSNAQLGARYRRITVDQDQIYDTEVKQWATITDTSYKELIFNFLNEKELPNSVVVGDPYIPRFYYYSTVGSARITVAMNGTTFTAGTVSSGDTISIDLTSRIVDGENTISIKFANSATEKFVNELRPIGININYSPAFDQYKPYDDSIIFNYSCTGSSAKVIHFDVTNANGEKTSHEISHNSGYFTGYATLQAEWFSKGENYIDTYMYAVDDNGNEIARTITTSYKVPFLTDSDPILMVYFDGWDELKQYASISVPYYVWRREAGNLDSIEFAITSDAINSGKVVYSYNTEDAGALVNYLQYNVGHNWLISSLPTSFVGKDDKKATFTIEGTYGENKTNKYVKDNVSIASSDSAMQTVEGYKFNFAATDLVKATDEWESTGTDKKVLQLEGFNWNTDGIKIDEEGNQSLHFASAASASLSEAKNPVFGNYDTPFTLEVSFKVSSSAAEIPIIKYTDPNEISNDPKGLYIYPNKAVFNYDGGKSEINFKSGERTHLTYTLCKKNVTDEDPTDGYKTKSAELLYLFVYINGILSQMKKLETNVKFPSNCGNIEFNTNHNEFDLYVFRGYAFSLSSAQILQNYISSFGDAAKKESLYLRNNLYNESLETGVQGEFEIDFSKVKGKIPCYVVVTDNLPESKDYNKCYGIYYEMEGESQLTEWKNNHSMATTYYYTREEIKNEDGEVIGYGDWFRNKSIKVGGQGTSSLAYPRKNLKFKHNDKFYIKGHKDGKDKTYTFKADYMDSSGANNIGNAQVLDDAIIREKWITTPVATDPDLRVNLDGFPVAVFWCQSSGLKGGVVQDENAEGVYDYFDEEKGLQPLYDAITVNPENPLIGEVTPLNPKYIGTFNFNYDKKAKALLGWNEDNFQGFEFRGNSSSCDLFRGFESFAAFASTAEGFEWRWTHISDWIDDYHDGHLSLTMDGGYFDEDVKQNYSEKAYLANREDIVYLKPFNRYYIEKDGKQLQLFLENEDGTHSPINYGSFDARNLGWNITDCEGISNPAAGICLEYGVKIGEKDGVTSFLYQLPYGLNTKNPWGKAYEDGSHYYKFSWNPQHEFKFEYNEDQEYWTDEQYWTAFAPLTKIKAREDVYTPSDEGTHVLDEDDGLYHEIANYPEGQAPDTQKYIHSVVYHEVTATDKIITWDFMKDIFKNWCYVNEAVAHCDDQNYRAVLDSREEYGENGNGLFVWDSLTNYMAASIITGLCDNFAKNMFMHSYDGGLTWSPAWYDMDTCFGLNNEGAYTKMYDIDFMDFDTTGARAFNGSNSKLWELIYNNSFDDLKAMYKELRKGGYIGYDKIMSVIYGENIAYKPESLYNASAVFRYMEPLAWHSNVKPEAAQGNRLQLLKYWNSNRQTFIDSRYEGIGWTGDIITLRLNNKENITFNLIPDTNMFLGINFNSGNADIPSVKSSSKVLAGNTWTCDRGTSTNLNTYIYGASHLLEVGDLSLCNSTEYSIATATNLRSLKIGDTEHPPKVITTVNFSEGAPYRNLTSIDLTNVQLVKPNLNFVLGSGVNLMPALQELKLEGSNAQYLTLGHYTPIKTLSLPSVIKKIELINLLVLEDVKVTGTKDVESVVLTNCPKVNQLDIISKFVNQILTISADHLNGSEEEAVTTDFMDWLYDINADIKGSIYVQNIADSNLNKYREKWAELTVNLFQIYEDDVIFGVEGLTQSTPDLTRIVGSKNFVAGIGYASDTEAAQNDFDNVPPWNTMRTEKVIDAQGNEWIRIYKYYTYYGENEVRISNYKIDENWVLNPKFIKEDGTELAFIEVSAYLCNIDGSGTAVSKTGTVATRGKTTAAIRAAVQNNNLVDTTHNYGVLDYWTMMILQDLYTIEFGTRDTKSVLYGYAGQTGESDIVSGTTDSIISSSGMVKDYTTTKQYTAMTYRGLENLIGVQQLIDGILVKSGELYYNSNHAEVAKNGDAAIMNKCSVALPEGGVIKSFVYDNESQLRVPNSTTNESETYYVDSFGKTSGDRRVYSSSVGLYGFNATAGLNNNSNTLAFRMIRTQK